MKIIRGIILTLMCVCVLTTSAYASGGTVDSLNVEINDGKIVISGNTNNVLACAVCVYDEKGTTLKLMETCQVNSDDTYNYTLQDSLSSGKYLVTVADYDGGNTVSKIVSVGTETETTRIIATTSQTVKNSVNTGDHINLNITVITMSVAAMVAWLFVIFKKRNMSM